MKKKRSIPHPAVPEGTPGMVLANGGWYFSTSWGSEDLPLDKASLHDDVYTVVGSLCSWWALRSGNAALADEWLDWMEVCGAAAPAGLLIGVCGKKRCGKDTVGGVLANKLGLVQDAFAMPIKDAAEDWFGLRNDQLYGNTKEVVDPRWNRTPRQIMQLLGTEVARQIHEDVWARAAMARHNARVEGTVLTDLRFMNEARILREHGGVVIYITRPGMADGDGHASEQEIEAIGVEAEWRIENNRDLAWLKAEAASVAKQFNKRNP